MANDTPPSKQNDADVWQIPLHGSVPLSDPQRFEKIVDDPLALLATGHDVPTMQWASIYSEYYFYIAGLSAALGATGVSGPTALRGNHLSSGADQVIAGRPKWTSITAATTHWFQNTKRGKVGHKKYLTHLEGDGVRPLSFFQAVRICAAYESVIRAEVNGANSIVDKDGAIEERTRAAYSALSIVPAVYTIGSLEEVLNELVTLNPEISARINAKFEQPQTGLEVHRMYYDPNEHKDYVAKLEANPTNEDLPTLLLIEGMARGRGVTFATAQRIKNALDELFHSGVLKTEAGEVEPFTRRLKTNGSYRYDPVHLNGYLGENYKLSKMSLVSYFQS